MKQVDPSREQQPIRHRLSDPASHPIGSREPAQSSLEATQPGKVLNESDGGMIRRIDQEVLEVVGLPDEIQRLLDAVGKRRMIVLLVEAIPLSRVESEDHESSLDMDGDSSAKTLDLLHRELESRYFHRWDLDQMHTVTDGDRVWIACDVHEWAFKARASRLLHEVNRRGVSERSRRRRRK